MSIWVEWKEFGIMKVSNRRSRVIILSVLILCCAATYWSADKIDAADSSRYAQPRSHLSRGAGV